MDSKTFVTRSILGGIKTNIYLGRSRRAPPSIATIGEELRCRTPKISGSTFQPRSVHDPRGAKGDHFRTFVLVHFCNSDISITAHMAVVATTTIVRCGQGFVSDRVVVWRLGLIVVTDNRSGSRGW